MNLYLTTVTSRSYVTLQKDGSLSYSTTTPYGETILFDEIYITNLLNKLITHKDVAEQENAILDKLNEDLSDTINVILEDINNTAISNIYYNGTLSTINLISKLYSLNQNYLLAIFYLYRTNNLSIYEIINLFQSGFNSVKEFLLYKLSICRVLEKNKLFVFSKLYSQILFKDFYDPETENIDPSYLQSYGMLYDNAVEDTKMGLEMYKRYKTQVMLQYRLLNSRLASKTLNNIIKILTNSANIDEYLINFGEISTRYLDLFNSYKGLLNSLVSDETAEKQFANAYIHRNTKNVYHNNFDRFNNINIINVIGDAMLNKFVFHDTEEDNLSDNVTTVTPQKTIFSDDFNINNVETDENGNVKGLLSNADYINKISTIGALFAELSKASEDANLSTNYLNSSEHFKPFVKSLISLYSTINSELRAVVENPTAEDEYHSFIQGDRLNTFINFVIECAESFSYELTFTRNDLIKYTTIKDDIFVQGIPTNLKAEFTEKLEQLLSDADIINKYSLEKMNTIEEKQILYEEILKIEESLLSDITDYRKLFYMSIAVMHLDSYIIWLLNESDTSEYSIEKTVVGYNTFDEDYLDSDTDTTVVNTSKRIIYELYKEIFALAKIFKLYKQNRTTAWNYVATNIVIKPIIRIPVLTTPVIKTPITKPVVKNPVIYKNVIGNKNNIIKPAVEPVNKTTVGLNRQFGTVVKKNMNVAFSGKNNNLGKFRKV